MGRREATPRADQIMKSIRIGLILCILMAGIVNFGVGCKKAGAEAEAGKQYTCPMHPEVVQNGPGKCPKCGMELKRNSLLRLTGDLGPFPCCAPARRS